MPFEKSNKVWFNKQRFTLVDTLPSQSGCAAAQQQGVGQSAGSHSGYPGLRYPEEEQGIHSWMWQEGSILN